MANLITDIFEGVGEGFKNKHSTTQKQQVRSFQDAADTAMIKFDTWKQNINSHLENLDSKELQNKKQGTAAQPVKNTTHSSFGIFKEDTGAIDFEKISKKFSDLQSRGKNSKLISTKNLGVVGAFWNFIVFAFVVMIFL